MHILCPRSECRQVFTGNGEETITIFRQHLKVVHNQTTYKNPTMVNNIQFECIMCQPLCYFGQLKSFLTHLKNVHLTVGLVTGVERVEANEVTSYIELSEDDQKNESQTMATKMMRELAAKSTISTVNINFIMKNFEEILNCYQKEMLEDVNKAGTFEDVSEIISKKINPFENALPLTDTSTFVKPQEIYLGSRIDGNFSGAVEGTTTRSENLQYISITDTLSMLMKIENYYNIIVEEIQSPTNNIENFKSGLKYRNNAYFQENPNAIRIILYVDDIEVVNPLGSKTKIHKLSAFYFSIDNLSNFNGKLENIFLLALCYAEDIKKYGYKKILEPFMNELKLLEEGVQIQLKTGPRIIRAALVLVVADSMAIHDIFGLTSPSSNCFCRSCYITRNEFLDRNNFYYKYDSRNRIEYEIKIRTLENSRQYGIKDLCILNDSKTFHVMENYTFDLMHDLLEGVCQLEIKMVLRHFVVHKKYFDVGLLNARIKSFKYGLVESKNKPSANFTLAKLTQIKENSIKQKAAQTWCLIRALPFIIADKVPENDEHLLLISFLLQIMQILFSARTSLEELAYLEVLILNHYTMFRKLFPEKNMMNKHHHMTHYVDSIIMIGPLKPYWCMRFEGKHFDMKKRAHITHNFRNIAKTLANQHQTTLSYNLLYKNCTNSVCISKSNNVNLRTATVNGTEYRKGSIILIDYTDDPVFGLVKSFQIVDGILLFKYQLIETVGLVPSLHAFEVTLIEGTELSCSQTDLEFPRPLALWKTFKNNNSVYISIRNF